MDGVHKFVAEEEGFSQWSLTKQVDYLVYYLTSTSKSSYVTGKDILLTMTSLDLKPYKRIRAYLSENTSKRTGKYIKVSGGYRLTRNKYNEIANEVTQKTGSIITKTGVHHFINPERILELQSLASSTWDMTKLIRFCEELNLAFSSKSFLSTPMLIRAILDHIPPIFSKSTFAEVANNYGPKSFKDSMQNLDKSSRKIADAFLHIPIRTKESLPNMTQVDFSPDLDVLLAEICRVIR